MRVLLVEDYEPLRVSLARGLRDAGYAVDEAGDGEEGLWYAAAQQYDTVVLDIMLPGIDGLALLERLRRQGNASPVLLLTARDTLEDRVAGLNRGADDYLTKPFALAELLARVAALQRRRYGQADPLIRVGALLINTATRTAHIGAAPVQLTPREYALLELLARRAGSVVTRTEIWERLYEFHASAESNVVDVYVGYLRRKLRRAGAAALIQTRRGHGYLLGDTP